MNEELQKALGELLSKANDGIDSASGFLVVELPEVIQQLLMWHGVYSLIECVIGLCVLPLFIYLDYRLGKLAIKSGVDEIFVMGYCTLGSVARILYLIPFGLLNVTWLQIWIAPKVWLIEYASKLVG